jgi:hypothetical protein
MRKHGMSKASRNRESARQRLARQRQEQARKRRIRKWLIGAGSGAVVAIGVAAGIVIAVSGGSASAGGPSGLTAISTLGSLKAAPGVGPVGPEGVPVPAGKALAGPSAKTTGQPIDGIGCSTSEQTLFHVHTHLAIFVNGQQRQVPAAIGIPDPQAASTPQGPFVGNGTCFYWLHTHAADGIIHIESPVQRGFTLGQFFDEWGQSLSQDQVGPAQGHVVALYDGKVFHGNPRNIPLGKHTQIQLEVGTPLIAPQSIKFPSTL